MECLLRDILFTLLGQKSVVLQHIIDNENNREFMFVQSEDRVLLKRILNLAEEYKKIHDRINNYAIKSINKGAYYEALMEGICMAVDPYKHCVRQIEGDYKKKIIRRECLMTVIVRKVEMFKPLITAINDIFVQIEFFHYHGSQILNLLYQIIFMRFTDDKAQLSLMLKQCLQVLILQLKEFFSRGLTHDPHKEFFIEAEFSKKTEEFKKFSLLENLLPCFITLSTASRIIRIGEVVKSLQHSHGQSSLILYKDVSSELYGEKKDQLFSDLLGLQKLTFFTNNEFVTVIDKFHRVIDEYMFKTSFNNNSIKYHMKLVRDFYLLGNGEFFMHFLNKVGSLSVKSEHNLRVIKVAFSNTAQDVKLNKSVYKIFGFSSLEKKEVEEITWSTIKVSMETTWPLQFIFSDHVQNNYSKLFSFLSRIKKVQTNLHQIWIEKKTKSYNVDDHDNQLKTKLTFFIDTLYSYLQLDVIEDEYFTFLEKLSIVNDFQTVKHLHDMFQINIMRDSFLFIEEVHIAFIRILDMCEMYCKYMTDITSALNPQYYKHYNDELSLLFTKKPNKLVTLLNTIKEIHVTPKPNQFLVRLNYNDWFSEIISRDI